MVNFLKGRDIDENDLDDELLINTKLENLEKLKFDDQKWEIDPKKFIIKYDQVLGEGNFGKVCMGYVSLGDELRDDDEIEKDFELLDSNNNDNFHPDTAVSASSRLKHQLSFRRNKNYTVNKGGDFNARESTRPLLVKENYRTAAVKMVKG